MVTYIQNAKMRDFLLQVEPLDEALIRNLSYTSQGNFAPLCAALGGIIAQEAIKALTGKFTPLNQWVSHFGTFLAAFFLN